MSVEQTGREGKSNYTIFFFLVEMTKKSKQQNHFLMKISQKTAMTVTMALQHTKVCYQLYYGLSAL